MMAGVTYDTGALIAAERNNRRMWALHMGFLALDVVPIVPSPVLAEAWRGGPRQASLARFIEGCDIEELGTTQARRVGVLSGKSRIEDIIDVTVVEGAVRRQDNVIVTSTESHIRQIAAAAGRRPRIELV